MFVFSLPITKLKLQFNFDILHLVLRYHRFSINSNFGLILQ